MMDDDTPQMSQSCLCCIKTTMQDTQRNETEASARQVFCFLTKNALVFPSLTRVLHLMSCLNTVFFAVPLDIVLCVCVHSFSLLCDTVLFKGKIRLEGPTKKESINGSQIWFLSLYWESDLLVLLFSSEYSLVSLTVNSLSFLFSSSLLKCVAELVSSLFSRL